MSFHFLDICTIFQFVLWILYLEIEYFDKWGTDSGIHTHESAEGDWLKINRGTDKSCTFMIILGEYKLIVAYDNERHDLELLFRIVKQSLVSLPQGLIQEIKRMLLMHLMPGLFLTWTQKSHQLQIIYYNIYTLFKASSSPTLCPPLPHVYLLGEPASLLMVANTHPPLSLVCKQLPHPLLVFPTFHTPQIKLQYLHRWHQQLQSSSSGTSLSLYCLNTCLNGKLLLCLHILVDMDGPLYPFYVWLYQENGLFCPHISVKKRLFRLPTSKQDPVVYLPQ